MTANEPLPRNLSSTSPDAAAEARAQADAYESLFASHDIELEGGGVVTVPPHPDFGMLDDEHMAAYEALQFEADTEYEREEDIFIPEQRLKNSDGKESGVVLPPTTQRGNLKVPYRKLVDGKSVLVSPPYKVQAVMAALGEAEYKRLRDGGRSSADVWKIWNKQGLEVRDRQAEDSKSQRSPVDLAAVPETDSQ